MLYLNSEISPFVLMSPKDDLTPNSIFNWISESITLHEMKWTRRASTVVQKLRSNAIVYIVPSNEDT